MTRFLSSDGGPTAITVFRHLPAKPRPRTGWFSTAAAGAGVFAVLLCSCTAPSPTALPTTGTAAVELEDGRSATTMEAPAIDTTGTPTPPTSVADRTGATATTEGVVPETAATTVPADPLTLTGSTGAARRDPVDPAEATEISVLKVFTHDPDAFTQGLVLHDGRFYESTGLYGRSSVRIVEPATGEVLASRALDSRYFGEGLAVVGERVVQLTWKEGTAFIWDARTLEPLGTYTYEGEGWGLCAFGDRFVMSDGSSMLAFRDLDTFGVLGKVNVHMEGEAVTNLNELECVGDRVYANVWYSDIVMVIDPDTGQVVASIDASSLRENLSTTEAIDVLNGIAYDSRQQVFYLTGKLWPELFEVRIAKGP